MPPKLPHKFVFIDGKTTESYIKVPGTYPENLPLKKDFLAQVKPSVGPDAFGDDQKLVVIGDYLDDLTLKSDTMDKVAIYGQIYFLTDSWIKNNEKDPRKELVNKVFLTAVNKLCLEFKCSVNVLPNKLEERWGRYLGIHGYYKVDMFYKPIGTTSTVAKYLDRKGAEIYRLTFIKGIAYQQTWFNPPPFVFAPAESSLVKYTVPKKSTDKLFEDKWAGFALSMGRDFFMGRHKGGFMENNFFHSSYTAGNAVLCSGSMLIEDGVVKGIKNDSGHYLPRIEHLLNAVESLKMYGVDIAAVTVKALKGSYDDKDKPPSATISNGILECKGDALLAYYSGGKAITRRMQDAVVTVDPKDKNKKIHPDHSARRLATPRLMLQPRIPTYCWNEYWKAAKNGFKQRAKRELPAPAKKSNLFAIPHSNGIEGPLTRCDLAHAQVIDRLYENISAVQAFAKFKTEVGKWEEACESYLLVFDKELANEEKFNRSKQDYAFELGEIKNALARLVEGITMAVVELGRKIHPQVK